MNAKSVLFATLLLSGCATQAPLPQDASTPMQVISLAATAAPQPVLTTIAMQVHAVGSDGGVTYLNSESDYRDQRNVSIAIPVAALAAVEAKFGGPLDKTAHGKHILVHGAARRVTIWFVNSDGQRSNKFYFQTHIAISDPDQIQVL